MYSQDMVSEEYRALEDDIRGFARFEHLPLGALLTVEWFALDSNSQVKLQLFG